MRFVNSKYNCQNSICSSRNIVFIAAELEVVLLLDRKLTLNLRCTSTSQSTRMALILSLMSTYTDKHNRDAQFYN